MLKLEETIRYYKHNYIFIMFLFSTEGFPGSSDGKEYSGLEATKCLGVELWVPGSWSRVENGYQKPWALVVENSPFSQPSPVRLCISLIF